MRMLFEIKSNGKKYNRSIIATTEGDTSLGLNCFPLKVNVQLVNIPFIHETALTRGNHISDVVKLVSYGENKVNLQLTFKTILDLIVATLWSQRVMAGGKLSSNLIDTCHFSLDDINIVDSKSFIKSIKPNYKNYLRSCRTLRSISSITGGSYFLEVSNNLMHSSLGQSVADSLFQLVKLLLKEKANIANYDDAAIYLTNAYESLNDEVIAKSDHVHH